MDSIKILEELVLEGKLSEALDFIEALPQEERQQWQIQNLTGIVCAYCGQHREARTFFEAALEQRPDDGEILYNLADTYANLNMPRKALEQLEQCQRYAAGEELQSDIAALRQRITEQKGGRVLMAAYYFPPLSGSGVFRSIKFAKYLPLFDWEPTVISTDRPPNGWNFADQSQLKEIPEGMEVVRIPDGISTGRETSLNGERVEKILNFLRGVLRFSPEADRIFSQLSQSREGIMQLLTFPCGALAWAYDVVQYIEKNIDLDSFQVVYTTSGPSSAHLIGFYLKQKYGIPWVADYRDPWTFNPYGADYDPANQEQRLLFELESVLLQGASCNLTIEKSMTEIYQKNFALSQEKIKSITNGYDESDFAALEVPKGRTDKFTINYSGLLYTRQRSIAPVLTAIQQLCDEKKIELSKLRFRIVGASETGNIEAAERFGLAQIMEYTGYLSHSQALQANLSANMLLLFVGDEEKFKAVYTGKFFEYLRSGRPILALAPKNGAVERVLRESGHGEAFLSTQISEIKAMILREYRKWAQGEAFELLHSPVIEQFERKVLTKQLADILSFVSYKLFPLPVHGSGGAVNCASRYRSIKKDVQAKKDRLAEMFLKQNYNYVWLKSMLCKATKVKGPNAVLITGSSYGVNGIIGQSWNQAVNCSVSSQDLYYDFLCAREAVSFGKKGRFSKCFIIGAYYTAYHDLSLGKQERELMISNVYYPIFGDSHNWNDVYQKNLWSELGTISKEDKFFCEQIAIEKMIERSDFFSFGKQRGGTVFNLNGRNWWDISAEERQIYGKIRAEGHNKLSQNKTAIVENKKILNEYVHFLHINGITPVFVVAPFTAEYNRYISEEMKESLFELIANVSENIHFIDFNQFLCFTPHDFVDTDHLSESGAEKFSRLLVNLFETEIL